MSYSKSTVITEHASKYLQQLCKHFGHKVKVEFTPEEGTVVLPFGTCAFTATADRLEMRVEGEAVHIGKLESFVASHLERFAFREKPAIIWQKMA